MESGKIHNFLYMSNKLRSKLEGKQTSFCLLIAFERDLKDDLEVYRGREKFGNSNAFHFKIIGIQ